MRNVWAIGDVTGEPMLAHRAMAQGAMVAEIIAGERRAFDHVAIPAICFTDPEIVAVGLSLDAAKAAHGEIRVGNFPFRANGRAMTLQDDEGFVRVVARADNHVVLGIQAVGQGVSELSAAFSLALEMGARLEDIALTIHAHPTLSEAFHEFSARGAGPPSAYLRLAARQHEPFKKTLELGIFIKRQDMGDILVRPHDHDAAVSPIDASRIKNVRAALQVRAENLLIVRKPVRPFPGSRNAGMDSSLRSR